MERKILAIKQTKRKILSLLLTLLFALFLAFLPDAALAQSSSANIDLTDATITEGTTGTGWTYASGVYTINDGADVAVTGASSNQRRIEVAAGATATVTLTDVTVDGLSPGISPLLLNSGANVTLDVEGTNTLTAGNDAAGIQAPAGTTLTITGSGTLNANGGTNGAGIGGGNGGDGGSVTVNGGTVNATGNGGAGIGGGNGGNDGSVTVNGGNVTATGNSGGAGIGGGTGPSGAGSGGNVTVSNGTVNATGGSSTVSGGAGIGGGAGAGADGGAGATVTISGGSVTANGGTSNNAGGAGIGGGGGGADGGAGGTVTVTGGSVTANGGSGANAGANIGSGGGDGSGVGAASLYLVAATAGAGGSISPAGSVGYTPGDNATVTVTPDSGYAIDSVNDNTTGTAGQLSGNTYTISSIDADHTITASFTEELLSIAVTTPPMKTTYIEGNTFDKTGMVVTAYYDNGTNAPVTGYTVTPDPLTFGTTQVTVTYQGKTATTPVTVAAVPTGVSVSPPTVTLTATGGTYTDNSITLTATVGQGQAYKPAPTGTVTFKEGDTILGTRTLNRYGTATFTIASPIDEGSYTFTAEYSGDATYDDVVSDPCTVDVTASLSVSSPSLHFDAQGGTQQLLLACNSVWSLDNSASWLSVAVSDFKSDNPNIVLNVTAEANPEATQRTALLTLSIPGVIVQAVEVTQDAGVNPATGLEAAGAPSVIVYSQSGKAIVKSDTPIRSVAVYDISGKLLKQVKGENNLITISGLPKQQVLIVRVTSGRSIKNYKLKIIN